MTIMQFTCVELIQIQYSFSRAASVFILVFLVL